MDCCDFTSSQSLHHMLFAQSKSEWLLPCCRKHKSFLADHCICLVVNESLRWAADAPHVLRCSTLLTRISSVLLEFCAFPSVSVLSLCLSHCLRFFDFPSAESIGYQCVSLLVNLVELHSPNCVHCQNVDKNCAWLLSVGHSLCGAHNEMFSKMRIKALHFLLHCASIEGSLPFRQRLFTDSFVSRLFLQIGHAPLSISISKLIVDDCAISVRLNRQERLNFHMEWIKRQLLATEAFVRCAIEQKLLPALLKSPESRRWFRSEFVAFLSLPRDSAHSSRAICTLLRLAIDRIGNEEGNCDFGWEDFVGADGNGGGRICADFMANALLASDSETQLSALSLLCSHPKGARPVSESECQLVLQFLAISLAEPSPSVRHQILTQIAKLFSRVSEHSKSLKKLNDVPSLAKYRQFICAIEQMALNHLPSESSLSLEPIDELEEDDDKNGESDGNSMDFSSRIFALLLLSLIHSSEFCGIFGNFHPHFLLPFSYFRLSSVQLKCNALVASLDDQFELCQDTALKLLGQIFSDPFSDGISFDFANFLESTKRDLLFVNPHTPRHQLAVEYRLRFVLPHLSTNVRLSLFADLIKLGTNVCDQIFHNCDDGNGTEKTPDLFFLLQIRPQLHAVLSALFVALPHIFSDEKATKNTESVPSFVDALLFLCHRCVRVVSPVVHSLSPEGFLPSSAAQLNANFEGRPTEDTFVTVQLLSKTCWRSHKFISHIFSRIIEWMPSPNSLSNDQLTKIGDYFWLQLTECRHCGAFEAAANAFRSVCVRFWKFSSDSDRFPCSPAQWLQQIVDALTGKFCARHLCPSRRSAGLPHLVNALLCSEPSLCLNSRRFVHFDRTLSTLLDCRGLADRRLEFHCVNVLRLLFSQAQLEERIFPFVEEAFRLSIGGCSDEFWPVRNAHVQLFAALIKRVFGTPSAQQRSLHIQPKCKMSAHEFFTRYHSLYHLLADCLHKLRMALLLRPSSSSSDCLPLGVLHHFSAFPALILLSHLRPVAHPMGQSHSLRPFLPHLIQLLFALPARALREIASAALCSVATFTELQEIFDCVFGIALAAKQKYKNAQNLVADSIQIFLNHINELNLMADLTSADRLNKLAEIAEALRMPSKNSGETTEGTEQLRKTIHNELLIEEFNQ
ncbi:hypothetical protein niasHT_000937 [Heterodera trifolii]|uniref:tRNA (32-2'-O)-methyltransferase regulator THADA n=1 Tax=Heterodera trifolii TaxID=157864 RepID=A0ABD2MCV3_9BILA